ncbi:vitellogenin-1-like, partial [Copidosoma floridanum]|uniref:vitellogenin-1-like n=1 Tax=Copidosoma floridanum TaxID=29053 RepID=UPI0006C9CAF3
SMEVGFPMANGWPFLYSLEVPSLMSVNGQLKGKVQRQEGQQQKQNEKYSVPFSADINGEAQITYSSQTRGKMGFVAPFANQIYIAGVERNFHVHVPIKGSIKYNPSSYNNSLETVLEPLAASGGKQQVFQSSTNLYTTAQDINEGKPYIQGQNALPVYSRPFQQIYRNTLGREVSGYGFDVTVRGEENFLNKPNIWKALRQHDSLSALLFSNTVRQLQNDYISVKYNPQKSSPQPINITLSFISNENYPASSSRFTKVVHPLRRSQKMSSTTLGTPQSYQGRREELLENVQSGMQDAKAHVLDASISFGSQQGNAGYSLTLAHANSPVSTLSRVLFFYKGKPLQPSENTKPCQASGEIEINDPRVSSYNFREALNQESTASIEGKLKMQQESSPEAEISFQGKFERTNERKEHVLQLSTARTCEEQMQRGDYFQSACRNVSLDANYMDKYNIVFDYQNVPKEVQRAIYSTTIYGMARGLLYPYNQEKIQSQSQSENQITVGVQFSKDLSAVNVSIATPSLQSQFEDIRMPQMAIPLFVYHPKYNQLQLISRKVFRSYPTGFAVLDGKSVTTFNNKSYPIDLGNCYHVFAVYAPHEEYGSQQQYKHRDDQRKFAILVKESNSQSREVLITIGNDEVHMKPGVSVQANGQEIQFSEQKISKWSNGENSIEGHVQNGGVYALRFPRQGIEVSYDGSRLQVTLPSFYKSRVRGLAGTYGGQDTEDFSAPDNRVLRNPLLFAASYALTQDQTCRGPAKERNQEAVKAPKYEKTVTPGNVVSDREAGREKLKTASIQKNHLPKQMDVKTSLTELRTRYMEEGDRTCFSTRPQISCSSHARATKRMQKNVDFHCIQTSSASRHWVQMIKNGANPDFSQKGSNHQILIALPQECQPRA